jgi:hypothetical protein
MTMIRVLAIVLFAGMVSFATSPAGAQTVNARIQPQAGNINPDGTRKKASQLRQPGAPLTQAEIANQKKTDGQKGIGQPLIPLQRPH